ncbi:MAG TPA: radical SAM protein [Chryseolinea sp.]|nr:radical SAM protein [Chryseolinea sp.]
MDILLTHCYFLEDDEKEQHIMRPYPPLGILYISGYLEDQGIQNEVYDTTFSSKKAFRTYLLTYRPRLIGIYVNLMTKLNVLETIRFVKEHLTETTIILGGPEVRYSAENFLRYGADYIVIGEGEETMTELVNSLILVPADIDDDSPGQADSTSRKSIAGIAFLDNDNFVQNPERQKIKDLNDLSIPNRKKINLRQYLDAWKTFHGKNALSVSTMRGCPYTCKWCSRAVYGLSYRRRNPDKVVEELVQIKKEYNPDSLWFVDDVFTISHKWLTSFRDELRKHNLLIPYECITRADRLNEEVILMLKETGCFRVWIGAESGSQKVIDLMDRRVDVNQVREMIQLTRKHGIEAGTFIMLGYPGETEEDIEETIRHLKKSNPDYFTITVAYPIKGTELYQEIEAVQTTNLDWSTSTDRQVDFKRTYSRKYYDYAVKRVINEVNYFKAMGRRPSLGAAKLKAKSLIAKLGMQLFKKVG